MLNRKTILPILWPLLLLLLGHYQGDLYVRLEEQRRTQASLDRSRRKLESLRAKTVAGRIEDHEYKQLLVQFAALTNLQASNPFGDPKITTLASVQVASLVAALQGALGPPPPPGESSEEIRSTVPLDLEFLPVSLGGQERMGPFVMVEFVLNLRGRFRAIPTLLSLLTEIGRQRKLVISIGEMRISATEQTSVTGDGLVITLPVRAYFRE